MQAPLLVGFTFDTFSLFDDALSHCSTLLTTDMVANDSNPRHSGHLTHLSPTPIHAAILFIRTPFLTSAADEEFGK